MNRIFTHSICIGILGLAPCACGSVNEPEGSAHATPEVTQSAPGMLQGYVHNLSHSRFRIGQATHLEVDSPDLQRWRGTMGTFALDPTNGAVTASLDAEVAHGSYNLDEVSHAANVKSYFMAAGLPADQIGEIQHTYMSAMMGGPEGTPSTPTLESINSIVRRRVQGILVAESEAWAKMTTSGDVDMEYVFWPAIEQSTVAEAVAFSKRMADSTAHAAFMAKLPGQMHRDIGVVIHHTDTSIHDTPTAWVAYDAVVDDDPKAAARHFDILGKEFRLPQEERAPVASTQRR